MPRKEYKTITVKKDTAEKFFKICCKLKKKDKNVDNGSFMASLLDEYEYVLK